MSIIKSKNDQNTENTKDNTLYKIQPVHLDEPKNSKLLSDNVHYLKLLWQEQGNNFNIDCELELAVHKNKSKSIMLIVPGVDGSVDGYKDKYIQIANNAVKTNNMSVVRMSNPYIGAHYWQSNVRTAIQYIEDNAINICGYKDFQLSIVGHSIGAFVTGQIAWEYPFIHNILLINPASIIDLQPLMNGLSDYKGKATIIIGSKDPAYKRLNEFNQFELSKKTKVKVIDGADHHFSGKYLDTFIGLTDNYLKT